jgi:hypothetical protein
MSKLQFESYLPFQSLIEVLEYSNKLYITLVLGSNLTIISLRINKVHLNELFSNGSIFSVIWNYDLAN